MALPLPKAIPIESTFFWMFPNFHGKVSSVEDAIEAEDSVSIHHFGRHKLMHGKEFAGSYRLSVDAVAFRMEKDPTWLEGVGALEIIAEDVVLVFPSNELPYAHSYLSSSPMIQRLAYTKRGVLIVANNPVPMSFREAFAAANPDVIPFVQGHYCKVCSPDSNGERKVYYSTLGQDSISHLISDDGSFAIEDVDILGLPTGTHIAATVILPNRSPDRQVFMLENSDDLGKRDFKPSWKLARWCEGYDVHSLEGFSNGLNEFVFLFIDGKTESLMKVVNDGKPEVLLKKVKVKLRAASGSETRPGHLTTVLTENRFIDLRLDPKTMEIDKDIWLLETNSSLEPLFTTVNTMVKPEGVSAPHGMFIYDRSRSQVLIYRHRPSILNRAES